VLYELASGRPPFYAKNLQELVNLILNSAPARLPAPFTDSFNDLIGRLLEKDATSRLDWPRLLSHPFFLNSNLALPAPLPLPPQPLFDQLVAAKQQPVRKTPSPTPSIASSPTPTQRTSPTPAETSARKSPSPGPQAPTVSGVDILRLSMNAKRHLSCEQDEYAARQPSSRLMSARDVPQSSLPAETSTSSSVEAQSDVEMQNYDVELNFGGAQDAENESEADDCAAAASATPAPRFEENDVEDDAGFDEVTELESPPSPSAAAAFDNARAAGSRPTSAIESPSTLQSASLVARPADTLSTRIDELMLHATDVAVKPLIGNPKIEKTVECKFDPKALPFRAFAVDEVLEMPKAELETFLSLIYKSISGDSTPITSAGGVTPPTSSATATLREKTNALGYFESLCSNAGVANVVINSSLMTMLVRLCVGDSNPAGNNAAGTNTTVAAAVTQAVANRAQLLHILGLLLRHATWIADELSDSGIVQTLAELLRDKSVKVRRKAVAALGELLFYIATHHETLPPGPARDRVWPVSKFAINMLLRGLRADEDECVQHYVAKAIENIAAQAAECAVEWFSQTEVMYSLLHIYNSSRSEHLRTTVASALSHLMRRNPALINSFLEKVRLSLAYSTVIYI
jgi:serine/threonine-protein kinase ULK4